MNNGPHIIDADMDRINTQASQWIVLLDDRELTDAEQDEFDDWLAADPRHDKAWSEMSRIWATLPLLNGLADSDEGEPGAAEVLEPARARWGGLRLPKPALGAVAAAAAIFVAFTITPSFLARPEVYKTDVAQTQLLMLDDGSQVTLGPRSQLTVAFVDAERRVVLSGGEAFFEVTHDKTRPFLVEAGGSTTRVLGTKFDVNYAGQSVRVGVLEGRVQVSRPHPDSDRQPAKAYLKAGQRAEINLAATSTALAGAPLIVQLSAPTPGAWREGRLVYENSRLSDLVSDVNRYYAPGVTVADKSILDLRVTASFKASEIPTFLASVGSVLPVEVKESAGGSYRLAAADR